MQQGKRRTLLSKAFDIQYNTLHTGRRAEDVFRSLSFFCLFERIVEAEPGIKERILSFFKGASADYADVPKLSGSAKWYYKKFKKMFDDFSARNSEAFVNEKSLTNINQGNIRRRLLVKTGYLPKRQALIYMRLMRCSVFRFILKRLEEQRMLRQAFSRSEALLIRRRQ